VQRAINATIGSRCIDPDKLEIPDEDTRLGYYPKYSDVSWCYRNEEEIASYDDDKIPIKGRTLEARKKISLGVGMKRKEALSIIENVVGVGSWRGRS
jgi:hypothetical protein